jgi:hypothetical protein
LEHAGDPRKNRWSLSAEDYINQAVKDVETGLEKVGRALPCKVMMPTMADNWPELDQTKTWSRNVPHTMLSSSASYGGALNLEGLISLWKCLCCLYFLFVLERGTCNRHSLSLVTCGSTPNHGWCLTRVARDHFNKLQFQQVDWTAGGQGCHSTGCSGT